MSSLQVEGTVRAPDFPPGHEWLNTAAPLTLEQLRGKVVLLDFWTYCCINCMHIIPDLKRLEAKYPRELVVVGVHSAKFDNEHQTANIRSAIERYEIEHPVINDENMQVWRMYGVRAWPTLVLINPEGRVIGTHSGEAIFDLFDAAIGETVEHFDRTKRIDRTPLKLDLERFHQPAGLLAFPGKIAADEKLGLLALSDSNHNRIVTVTFDGEVKDVIGDGEIGLRDGSFETARFFRPQGVYLDGDARVIYVADTENHAIRKIDLNSRTVATLAGDGNQARAVNREGKGVQLN
ncbi:MAG TPA: thioredoxin-like domain-containing protein, partial [Candidatus Binataceae bacterium]|nr:thioredoxin-like domain-containing protein [Candidatus Binataceae bacterium]